MPRGTPSTLSTPSSVFEEDETKEATEKSKKSKKNLKNQKKKKQYRTNFCLNFSQLPPKRCIRGWRLHPQRPQSVEKDKAEEASISSSSNVGWGKQTPFYSTARLIEIKIEFESADF